MINQDRASRIASTCGRYHYQRFGLREGVLELVPNGKILRGPGHAEVAWEKLGSKLVFYDAQRKLTATFDEANPGVWNGQFSNDGRSVMLRRIRSDAYSRCCICARIDTRVVKWLFHYEHDFVFFRDVIFPWAMSDRADCEIVEPESQHDFLVGVYLYDLEPFYFGGSAQRFLISAEPDVSYESADCIRFLCNDQFRGENAFYSPPMCMWASPASSTKTKLFSAIDSGKRGWRLEELRTAARRVPRCDLFGVGFDNPLPYGDGEKSQALAAYRYSLAIEHTRCSDYFSEKLTDITMNEGVAVYRGATRIQEYYLDDAWIPLESIESLSAAEWEREYERRREAVLRQKELIRTRFNIFRYFDIITGDLSLLQKKRPVTLEP